MLNLLTQNITKLLDYANKNVMFYRGWFIQF